MEFRIENRVTVFGTTVQAVFMNGGVEADRIDMDKILSNLREGGRTMVFDPSRGDYFPREHEDRRALIEAAHAFVENGKGSNLKEICREHGLERVAEVIGCTPSTLTRKRCAVRPVHEVEHLRLKQAFPEYSIEMEVQRQAGKRSARSQSK